MSIVYCNKYRHQRNAKSPVIANKWCLNGDAVHVHEDVGRDAFGGPCKG